MLRVTLKGVRGHLLRFLLTTLSVMLGAAFVAGTFILTDSLQATFDEIFNGASRGVDVVVRGPEVNEGVAGGASLRQPLKLTQASELAKVDGVAAAYPDLTGSAVLVGSKGTAVRNGGAPSFAFAYHADDPALPLSAGRAPASESEIAVETKTLKLSGLKLGDRSKLVVAGAVQPVTIVGVVDFGRGLAGATIVVVEPQVAQRWFAPDGTVQSFSLRADKGVSQQVVRDRVAATLPSGEQAITGAAFSAEQRTEFAKGLGFINTFLLVFAFISLLVGAFIIFNTFSMLVAQRTRELALLRAVGASRQQVIRVVLGEAAVIGLIGGALGLLAGVGLAAALQALVATFGLDITGGLPIHTRTIVWSLMIGLVVTVLSAVLPAWRAGRIAPVAAMRDDVALPERSLRLRGIVGLVVIAAGAFLMGYAVSTLEGNSATQTLGAGAFLAFIGMVIAAPLVSRPVIRVLGAPGARLTRTVGRLARDNTLRNPRRTSTTAVSLMIGLALVSAFSVLAATTKASIDRAVDTGVRADFILSGGNAPFPNVVAENAAKVPGVVAVVDQGLVPVAFDGQTTTAAAVSMAGLRQTVKLTAVSGDLDAVDRGDIAVSQSYARDRGLVVGKVLRATVGTLKEQQLRVGAVFKDSQALSAPVLVPRALYTQAVPTVQQVTFAAYVKVAPDANARDVRAALTALVQPQLVISVQDRAEFKAASRGQVDQLLGILYALLGLSVVIAALGIVNTLALSVFERTREIGLLRAVGMSRSQLRHTIATEAVLTALFGAVLGTVLGLTLGVLLQKVLSDDGLTVLAIPWTQTAGTFVLAGVVGVLAALWPAWRASRLDVIAAVSSD